MPLYDFRCKNGHTFERMIPLANFSDPVLCSCNAIADRLISTPMISVENVGYNCPITGKWIGSKRAHEENLAEHGCRVLETGEQQAATAFRASKDAELDKIIEDTVEREIEAMPSAKKEQLANELINGGLTAEIVRETA